MIKRSITGVFLSLAAFLALPYSEAATKPIVKSGASCPASGKVATLGKSTFTCTKQGKKLIWVLKPTTPVIKYFQLNYGTDIHGSIAGNGSQRLVAGTAGTEVTAMPSNGYQFDSWSDGKAGATRSDTPTEDLTLIASFKRIYFSIAYSADSHGTIAGESSQTLPSGTVTTSVTAIPMSGYLFDSWSDGRGEATRSDSATSNQSFVARFKATTPAPAINGHTIGSLLWSDEFNANTSTIDSKSWTARNCGSAPTNGGSTCMTGEVQYFAPSAVKLDGAGNLTITAQHTTNLPPDAGPCGSWGGGCPFVSGRLDTQGKVSFQYGYIEARIKMPKGGGNWPAFWMLGNNITQIGWPSSGEIDIVEAGGDKPTLVHGSLNYKGGNGSPTYVTAIKNAPDDLSSDFHTYGVLWLENIISFYFDGQLYESQTPSTINSPYWSFNAPFFVILNNAIAPANSYFGGNWDGWSSSMMNIDYVRSWQVDGQGTVTKP